MSNRTVKTSIPEDLARTLDRLASEQERSISSLIAEALHTRYGGQTPRAQEATLETTRRQLTRLEARLDALVAEKVVLKECILAFVRIWLEYNPPMPDELAESLAMSADARFDQYLVFVADGLGRGRSIAGNAFAAVEQNSEGAEP